MAELRRRLAVEIDERPEAPRFASDDRNHQRQPEYPRALERCRCASDPDPYGKRILDRPRIDALPGKSRTESVSPLPRHMLVVPDPQEQVEVFFEVPVVVLEIEPEQGIGVDERPASSHDL